MNSPVILYRKLMGDAGEFDDALRAFNGNIFEYRVEVPQNSLVFGRYSVLPHYAELTMDLVGKGARLINSWAQHKFIASFDYYELVKEFTPQTWNDKDFYKCDLPGPFVVKGGTNSKKWQWNKLCFAKTKTDAINIAGELSSDDFIGPQGIFYRKFEPLVTYETGINGLPFTNEWRFFFLGEHLVDYGYYWSIADKPELASIDDKGVDFAKNIANIVAPYVNFFVLDVAQKINGDWILIEINDAQCAGLSMINPKRFYNNLRTVIKEQHNFLTNIYTKGY